MIIWMWIIGGFWMVSGFIYFLVIIYRVIRKKQALRSWEVTDKNPLISADESVINDIKEMPELERLDCYPSK